MASYFRRQNQEPTVKDLLEHPRIHEYWNALGSIQAAKTLIGSVKISSLVEMGHQEIAIMLISQGLTIGYEEVASKLLELADKLGSDLAEPQPGGMQRFLKALGVNPNLSSFKRDLRGQIRTSLKSQHGKVDAANAALANVEASRSVRLSHALVLDDVVSRYGHVELTGCVVLGKVKAYKQVVLRDRNIIVGGVTSIWYSIIGDGELIALNRTTLKAYKDVTCSTSTAEWSQIEAEIRRIAGDLLSRQDR
ncbi:MAG: hypothetical protein PVI21_00635 [Candidatus Woesebacteria bacterium]|jgi:hypothetical protein